MSYCTIQDIECRIEFQKWWKSLLKKAEDNAMKDSSRKLLFDSTSISLARVRTKNQEETQLTKWWNNLIRPTKINGKRCHRQTGMNHDISHVSQVPQYTKSIDRYSYKGKTKATTHSCSSDDLKLVILYKRKNDENDASSDELDCCSSSESNSCDNPNSIQNHSSSDYFDAVEFPSKSLYPVTGKEVQKNSINDRGFCKLNIIDNSSC